MSIVLLQSMPSAQSLIQLAPFILIIPVFYFLLIRPNQKRQRVWQEMLGNLKSGDRITTTGGVRGTVVSIKDDAIILKLPPDNIRIEVARSAIASVTTNDEAK